MIRTFGAASNIKWNNNKDINLVKVNPFLSV